MKQIEHGNLIGQFIVILVGLPYYFSSVVSAAIWTWPQNFLLFIGTDDMVPLHSKCKGCFDLAMVISVVPSVLRFSIIDQCLIRLIQPPQIISIADLLNLVTN